MVGPETPNSEEETDDDWSCGDHNWLSIGVTISNGMMTRVWKCTDCLAWTQEGYGRKYEIQWHETSMYGGPEDSQKEKEDA